MIDSLAPADRRLGMTETFNYMGCVCVHVSMLTHLSRTSHTVEKIHRLIHTHKQGHTLAVKRAMAIDVDKLAEIFSPPMHCLSHIHSK